MYRQFDSTTVRKEIISPKAEKAEKKDSPTTKTTRGKREKRQPHEPASMADYVTDLHAKRRRSKTEKNEESKPKQAKLTATSTQTKTKTKKEGGPESPIPKVKVKLQTIAIRTSPKSSKSPSSAPEKLIDHCNIDLSQQQKNKNYVFFPVMDIDDEEDSSDAEKTKNDETKQQNVNVTPMKFTTKQKEPATETTVSISKTSATTSPTKTADTTPAETKTEESVTKTSVSAVKTTKSTTKTTRSTLKRSESAEKDRASPTETDELSVKTSESASETSVSAEKESASPTETSESSAKTSESATETSESAAKVSESATERSELEAKTTEMNESLDETSESTETTSELTSAPATEILPSSTKTTESMTETITLTTITSELTNNLTSTATKPTVSAEETIDTRKKTTRRSSANSKYKTPFVTSSVDKKTTEDSEIKISKSVTSETKEIDMTVKRECTELKTEDRVERAKPKSENDETSLKPIKRSRRISGRMESKLLDKKSETKPNNVEIKQKIANDFSGPKKLSSCETKQLRKSVDALQKVEVADSKEQPCVKLETKQQRKSVEGKQSPAGVASEVKVKTEPKQRKSTDTKLAIDENIEGSKKDEINLQRRSERRRTAKSFDDHELPQSVVTRKKTEKPTNIEKGGSKNFEQKYEEFKQKWKVEKEKRRLLKNRKSDSESLPTVTTKHSGNTIPEIGKLDFANLPGENLDQVTTKEFESSLESKHIIKGGIKERTKVTCSPVKKVIVRSDKPQKGWPKGRPRKKKEDGMDTSRTPNVQNTISFASMVSDERPSLKKRNSEKIKSPPMQHKDSKKKLKSESLAYDNLYKSYTSSNTSLTQIVASKIQRKAHQQQKQNFSLSDPESNKNEGNKNELDLTGITLSTAKSPPNKQPEVKRQRKSLDFITGRLKFKKKMEALKVQTQDNKTDQVSVDEKSSMASVDTQTSLNMSPVRSIAQPTTLTAQISQAMVGYDSSQPQYTNSRPLSITPPAKHLNIPHLPNCKCWNCFQNAKQMLKTAPCVISTAPCIISTAPCVMSTAPYLSGPSYPAASMIIASGGILTTPTLAPVNVVPIIQQRKGPVRIIHTPTLPSPSYPPAISPSQSQSVKQEPSTLISPTKAENQRKRKHAEDDKQSNDNNKKLKTVELRRTRRDSEKNLKTTKSDSSLVDEYTCTLPGCGKSFRKQHLLDYHLKYFHTAKPSIRRNRSSISVSSTDSNPFNALSSPIDTSKNISNVSIKQEESAGSSINISNEVDVVMETSEEDETESESETTTVDDCVKCICEDECELGFMIQCEQCFTWQHGECVGYLTQKNVPLFYLCHVCSNPKGLRPSCKYNNDFTWQRFGRIPPVNDALNESKIVDSIVKETVTSIRHVDKEDEEILGNIMIASHAMLTDLHNIKDVLQNVRQNFVMIRNSKEQQLTESTPNEDMTDEQLEKLLLQIERNSKKDKKLNNGAIKDESTEEGIAVTPVKVEDIVSKPITSDSTTKTNLGSNMKVETVECEKESNVNKEEASGCQQNASQSECESKLDQLEETNISQSNDDIKISEACETSDIIQSKQDTDVPEEKTHENMDQLNLSLNLNDQSETDTETADEQVDDIKIENEITEENDDKKLIKQDPDVRPFLSMKDLPELPTEMATRENVVARFELLVEIERIEDEIEQRLKDLNKQLDLLETEYDNIDRSKEILRHFKEKFQLPDMNSLAKFLHRIKWTSVRQKK